MPTTRSGKKTGASTKVTKGSKAAAKGAVKELENIAKNVEKSVEKNATKLFGLDFKLSTTIAVVITLILTYTVTTELYSVLRQWNDYRAYQREVTRIELENAKNYEEYLRKIKEKEQEKSVLGSVLNYLNPFSCPSGTTWSNEFNKCVYDEENPYQKQPLPAPVAPINLVSVQIAGLLIQMLLLSVTVMYLINPTKGANWIQNLYKGSKLATQVFKLAIGSLDMIIMVYNIYIIYSLYNSYQQGWASLGSFLFNKENLAKILFVMVSPYLLRFVSLVT